MSLLSESMESCLVWDKTTQADGYGGMKPVWVQGAEINAAIVLDSSTEARIAEAQGVKSLYTVVTNKATNLDFGTVIQRLSDSKYFRITSDGSDRHTPASAGLDMRAVSAEWMKGLPDG